MDSAFGRILPITSAGRTWDEQNEAYQRYKRGQGPLALPPGTSIHERGNAIDWGSSVWGILGLNSGLGWRDVPANKNGHRRTVPTEVWHTEYDPSRDLYIGSPAGGITDYNKSIQEKLNRLGYNLVVDGDVGPATIAAIRDFQSKNGLDVDGVAGPATNAKLDQVLNSQGGYGQYGGAPWIKAIQNKLNRLGFGPLDEDGEDGPKTQAAVKAFQSKYGLNADGIAGPITNNKMDELLTAAPIGRNASARSTFDVQKRLIALGYDLGSYGADGDYGAATTAAVMKFQRDQGLEADGIWGPVTDAKAFATLPTEPPDTKYPSDGRNATTRPTADIQKLVGVDPDGAYGPLTSQAVAKWQSKNGLDADGIWGPASDLKGFPGVPLPDAPANPEADPLYGKKHPLYPGATWADVSPNKSVREGDVKLFIIHHRADTGTAASARKRFMTSNDRNVSPNWNVNQDGTVDEIVPPDDYRAWTTGAVDHQAVTVETGNSSGEPTWGITPESHEAIANIVAWWGYHYVLPIQKGAVSLVDGKNVVTTPGIVGHRDTPAGKDTGTVCPGPSMNIDWIITRAKEIYQAKYVEPPVDPEPGVSMTSVPTKFLEDLRANQLSDAAEISKYLV